MAKCCIGQLLATNGLLLSFRPEWAGGIEVVDLTLIGVYPRQRLRGCGRDGGNSQGIHREVLLKLPGDAPGR